MTPRGGEEASLSLSLARSLALSLSLSLLPCSVAFLAAGVVCHNLASEVHKTEKVKRILENKTENKKLPSVQFSVCHDLGKKKDSETQVHCACNHKKKQSIKTQVCSALHMQSHVGEGMRRGETERMRVGGGCDGGGGRQ